MTARAHAMPFGARTGPDGVLFQLWAPDAERVTLGLRRGRGRERRLAMAAAGDGWHRRLVPEAAAGDLYRYRPRGGPWLPDPASRCQAADVHGPSLVVDPTAHRWRDDGWRGRPWHEAVLYELHVGTFTPAGDFAGVESRLDDLARLGVTAVELMPVADFPGRRNWGYDGVLPFAPDRAYGGPDDLKRLVEAAHARGLMVLLDVVYNHFGPDGNYLHLYASPFFTRRHRTPWGAAIDFEGPRSRVVRDFFVHNALYWLQEYHLDGLRLDAVHAIRDGSRPDILRELAERAAAACDPGRHVHLVLENDDNGARYLERDRRGRPRWYVAQWNDDLHHAAHVLLTGEDGGYYADFAADPARCLARALAEGFAYQGEPSPFRDGAPRGEASAHLPPLAFVSFLQNHDQVGNRARGERLTVLAAEPALRALTAVLCLAPQPPLLFMGQERGSRRPFLFFCDFTGDLARAVTRGRRAEFARFPEFADPAARRRIPDPAAEATFLASVLPAAGRPPASPEAEGAARPEGPPGAGEPAEAKEEADADAAAWWRWHARLLEVRRRWIVPRLAGAPGGAGRWRLPGPRTVAVSWRLAGDARLHLLANLRDGPGPEVAAPPGRVLLAAGAGLPDERRRRRMGPWSLLWTLEAAAGGADGGAGHAAGGPAGPGATGRTGAEEG